MPTPVKKSSSRNRAAGHKYERDIVRTLLEAGFPHVVSSRAENRSRDNAKVDICNKDEYKNGRLPYNIQCKTIAGPVSYAKLLSEIECLDSCKNVILHRFTKKSAGGKFMVKGEYAIMHQEDFVALIGELNALQQRVKMLVDRPKKYVL